MLAGRAGPPMIAFPFAKDVNGDHFPRGAKRGEKGGVIVEAEIAAEPMDDALHGQYSTREGGEMDSRIDEGAAVGQTW